MEKSKSEFDRPQPFSMECEQALLSSCIIDGGQDSITACIQERITPDAFYLPAHGLIFKTLLELYSANIAINELIVTERLATHGNLEKIGGYDYISTIANRIDTPAHLHYYISRVKDLSLVRKVITVAHTSIQNAYSGVDDIGQFLDNVEQSIFAIAENHMTSSAEPIRDSIDAAVGMIQRMFNNRGEVSGVASGFKDLDQLTFGFHPGEMIVLAARPSMGKTSFALNIAENVVTAPSKSTPTLFFSLEMSAEQLAMRLLCSRSGVDMTKLRNGFIPKSEQAQLSAIAVE
jgi:replicative DNA helicase